MAKYNATTMRFMKIRSKNDDYYYLGECSDERRKVYVPTLDKSFSYDEVVIGDKLSSDHVYGIFGLSRKVKLETDDFGYDASYIKGDLTGFDVKRIEKEYNCTRKPSKFEGRFDRK